jgi:hypothetical protein
MVEKDYYRLNELEQKFGFSSYDYIYLCEQFNNPIRFYIYSRYFLVTKPTFTEVEVLGVAAYKGVINLKPKDRKRLLQDNEVEITECSLAKKTSITMLERPSEIFVKNCLSILHIIQPLNFDNISDIDISARIIEENNRDMVHTETDLLTASLSLHLQDMVVTLEDIDWAKNCLFNEGYIRETKESDSERENIFHTYLKKLIKTHPRKGASALWGYILQQHNEDNDLIDPYYLLREMSTDKIIWGQGNDTDRTMTKGTFKNLVSRFKK